MNGERAKRRRKELGLTAETVAQALKTTRVTISRWEAGISEPDDRKKALLAKVLKTNVAYLMGDTDNPEKDNSVLANDISGNVREDDAPLSLAYWGEVADKTRDVAKSGNVGAINYVTQILHYALSLLPDTSSVKGGKETNSANYAYPPITNMSLIVGDHNSNSMTAGTATA